MQLQVAQRSLLKLAQAARLGSFTFAGCLLVQSDTNMLGSVDTLISTPEVIDAECSTIQHDNYPSFIKYGRMACS